MVETPVILTIGSICLGFVLFVLAACGTRGQWNRRAVTVLFVSAIGCLTVLPVIVALSAGV